MGGLGKHLSHQDREILEREGIGTFTRPKGWQKTCNDCYYWTGKGNNKWKYIGNEYKCYTGSCPAKARDMANKEKRKRNRKTP